ncbi:hypothetical protein D3C87_1994180 [compost metagenome]
MHRLKITNGFLARRLFQEGTPIDKNIAVLVRQEAHQDLECGIMHRLVGPEKRSFRQCNLVGERLRRPFVLVEEEHARVFA